MIVLTPLALKVSTCAFLPRYTLDQSLYTSRTADGRDLHISLWPCSIDPTVRSHVHFFSLTQASIHVSSPPLDRARLKDLLVVIEPEPDMIEREMDWTVLSAE